MNADDASINVAIFQGWQLIETAPHNELVLLYCPYRCASNDVRIELGYASRGERIGPYSSISYHGWATHWMPLPNPPEGSVP